MYILKHVLEDFVVDEEFSLDLHDSGTYSIYKLSKRDCNTLDAIKDVARLYGCSEKDIGFAGTKDRKALTTQHISIKNGQECNEVGENVSCTFLGKSSHKIALGCHRANKFTITIRNLDDSDIETLKSYEKRPYALPNYFGPQRFGKNNADVGRALIKKEFREATELIVKQGGKQQDCVRQELEENPNNVVGAIQRVPLQLIRLYVGAYQALLYNVMLRRLMDHADRDNNALHVPLIGFGIDPRELENEEVAKTVREVLKQEKLSPRDFIIRQFPQLSVEGQMRDAFVMPDGFCINTVEDDDFFTQKKKAVVTFALQPSSYATTVLDVLLNNAEGIRNDFV